MFKNIEITMFLIQRTASDWNNNTCSNWVINAVCSGSTGK